MLLLQQQQKNFYFDLTNLCKKKENNDWLSLVLELWLQDCF